MTLRAWFAKNGRCLLTALTTWSVCVFATFVVFRLLARTDRLIPIWPLTGLQVALLLPVWRERSRRGWGQLGGVVGVLTGMMAVGLPAWFALSIGCISGVDTWIAGTLLSRKIQVFEDLKRRQNLLRFVLAATVAPAVCGALAVFPMMILLHKSVWIASSNSLLADSLGLGVLFPALFFVLTGKYRDVRKLARPLRTASLAMALFVAACGGIFWQNSYPLLFLVFPPMTLVLLALGLEGAVLTSLTVAVIACYATAHGHGPVCLVKSSIPEYQVLMLQLFLWMATATALPVGAMLDERRRAEREGHRARTIYRTLLQHANDMIVLSTMDGGQRYVSAASERLTGWTPEEFMAMDRMAMFHPDDRHLAIRAIENLEAGKQELNFQYRLAQKGGGWRWVEATVRSFADEETGQTGGYVGTIRDISELKLTEEGWTLERRQMDKDKQAMAAMALTDALTGLPNRRAFDLALSEQLAHAEKTGGRIALVMIDVDCFKLYNDRYGHQAGDECLRQIAEALRGYGGRTSDLLARWGGEEFAVLLPGASAEGAERLAEAMRLAVRASGLKHQGSPHGVATVSVGLAVWEAMSGMDPHLWVQAADQALYASKQGGRDRVTASAAQAALVEEMA